MLTNQKSTFLQSHSQNHQQVVGIVRVINIGQVHAPQPFWSVPGAEKCSAQDYGFCYGIHINLLMLGYAPLSASRMGSIWGYLEIWGPQISVRPSVRT